MSDLSLSEPNLKRLWKAFKNVGHWSSMSTGKSRIKKGTWGILGSISDTTCARCSSLFPVWKPVTVQNIPAAVKKLFGFSWFRIWMHHRRPRRSVVAVVYMVVPRLPAMIMDAEGVTLDYYKKFKLDFTIFHSKPVLIPTGLLFHSPITYCSQFFSRWRLLSQKDGVLFLY